MTDRNDRIREIAYFLWLEKGCPEGRLNVIGSPQKAFSIPILLYGSGRKARSPASQWAIPQRQWRSTRGREVTEPSAANFPEKEAGTFHR